MARPFTMEMNMDIQREARLIALGVLRHKGLLHILPKGREARKQKLDAIVRRNPRIMERAKLAIYARKKVEQGI